MSFVIEPVTNGDMARAVDSIREEVFGREHRLNVLVLRRYRPADTVTLLARAESGNEPVATLTAVNTSGDSTLHSQFGLRFPEDARVARYTQMAVLRKYRGMNLPLRLMLEARRRFIIPNGFEYTWFLFDAVRARNSCFAEMLGFRAGSRTFQTEYGSSRVLVRDEAEPIAGRLDRRLETHLGVSPALPIPATTSRAVTAA